MRSTTEASLSFVADAIGAVSVLLGGFLLVAPRTSGRWLELNGTPVLGGRALGTADVALGVAMGLRRR